MTGGEDLARIFGAMGPAFRPVLNGMLKRAGEPMRARMASLAPRSSGEIQRPDRAVGHMADHMVISVVRKIEGEPLTEQQAGIAIGPAAAYWWSRFSEYGTIHQPARAFARPAFDTTVDQALGIIQDESWALIRSMSGSSSGPSTGGGLL